MCALYIISLSDIKTFGITAYIFVPWGNWTWDTQRSSQARSATAPTVLSNMYLYLLTVLKNQAPLNPPPQNGYNEVT